MNTFAALLELTRSGFTTPGFAVFTDLLTGWVLAPGRRTITGMIAVGDPVGAAPTTPTTGWCVTGPGP